MRAPFAWMLVLAAAGLTACAAAGGDAARVRGIPAASSLSADQRIFEISERGDGSFTLDTKGLPGTADHPSGSDYFVSIASGGLRRSPLAAGPQTQRVKIASLDRALRIPSDYAREHEVYLAGGAFVRRSVGAKRRVSYQGTRIAIDLFADDDSTIVKSLLLHDFTQTSLSGRMKNAPSELQSAYPFGQWVADRELPEDATWRPGSFYTTHRTTLAADADLVDDCPTARSMDHAESEDPIACTDHGTLEEVFPVVLLDADEKEPFERDEWGDGTITVVDGLRAWRSNKPLPPSDGASARYRMFVEKDGAVYATVRELAGSRVLQSEASGAIVEREIDLDVAAVASIRRGWRSDVPPPGAPALTDNAAAGIDIHGLGATGPNGTLAPADLWLLYGKPGSLDGTGQTIAIVGGPGTGDLAVDLNVYSSRFGLPVCDEANPCLQVMDLSATAGQVQGEDFGTELAMDTQLVHAMAPGAHLVVVKAASTEPGDMLEAIDRAVSLPGVTAISMSFGFSADEVKAVAGAEDARLAGVVAKGMILFASSGDYGHDPGGPDYPAASPVVTAVGGTRILAVGGRDSVRREEAWRFGGGGPSAHAAMPTWQRNAIGAAQVAANGGMRAVPDVAAVSDVQHSPVAYYYGKAWGMGGGTSAAVPIWAGISALLAQHESDRGRSLAALVAATPGGFNGWLYQRAWHFGAGRAFHDIDSGSNEVEGPCDICDAGAGYDDVTGLGAPDVAELAAAL